MLVERWRRIESLFNEALVKSPEERPRFLDEACSDDPALRREVDSLLAHASLAGDFLESDASETAPARQLDLVPTGERIGPYTVIELLGTGGMGEVYRAHDHRLDRDIAVKFVSSRIAGDAASLDRFEREARAASALNHPNICTVHDVGETHGRRFIVMELLEGQSLKDRIAEGPLSTRELAGITREVCAALQAAHERASAAFLPPQMTNWLAIFIGGGLRWRRWNGPSGWAAPESTRPCWPTRRRRCRSPA